MLHPDFTPLRSSLNRFRSSRRVLAALVAGAAVATMAACGGSSSTAPRTIASITVTPNPVTLLPGQTQQFTATGKDASGSTVAFTPTWTVTSGGSINGSGLFTAGTALGIFQNAVQASSGNISGSSAVTVSVVADFLLTSVNGKAPPDTVVNNGTTVVVFLDGILSLHQDLTYRLFFHNRTTTNGTTTADTSGSSGTYTVNGTAVTIRNSANNGTVVATLAAPTISFTDNGELFLFTKQ